MRCAVFVVTDGGLEIARQLFANLSGDSIDIFVKKTRILPSDMNESERAAMRTYGTLAQAVAETFKSYDALIFITAIGIAVRMIAPHIKSKLSDPAVIEIDERGGHTVSILSGHVGGANALTPKIADALKNEPIITTATDVNNLIAPDSLAPMLGLRPTPKPMIEVVNGAILEKKIVAWYIDSRMKRREFFRTKLARYGIAADVVDVSSFAPDAPAVLITDDERMKMDGVLFMVPRRLIAGIGCRRGATMDEIRAALIDAVESIGQDVAAVSEMASTTKKSDEAGLLELAKSLGIDIKFFENDIMQETIDKYHLNESSFVKKNIGIGNVCEAAALSAAGEKGGRWAMGKAKYAKVTVALLWEK